MTGALTKQLQIKIVVNPDGFLGAKTEASVQNFQRAHNLVPDGIVGPKTLIVLDNLN